MRNVLFFIFIFFPFIAFSQKIPIVQKLQSENIIEVDLYPAYQNRNIFPLSKVAESLEYIPLETTTKSLIGSCYKIFVTSKDIFVFDFKHNVYRFNRNGRFIKKIGRIGRGPGECQGPIDVALDTINEKVIFLDYDKLVVYDYNASFIHSYKLKRKSVNMLNVNKDYFLIDDAYYQYSNPAKRFSMYFFSQEQKKEISKIACEKKDKIPFSICHPIMYKYNRKAFVKDYWSDTIYQVVSPFQLKAHASINTGKLKHRDNDDKSIITGEENPGDTWVISISKISESDRFIFLTSNKGLFVYDKMSKEIFCCEYQKGYEYLTVFKNNLSSGPNLLPFSSLHFVGNNQFVTYNFAYEFFEKNSNKLKTGLDKSLKNLKPDDNPVLVLIKFKQ
jgi:hypothetical protein